ncbi:glycosyltransferase [Ornithinimicrobium sp. LYQ92]|uniref:glycosyltransferase family protein n=1 Tax=Serinicoccus sp. LYQ92 TaxID=3378798 RepID=UPI0038522C8D
MKTTDPRARRRRKIRKVRRAARRLILPSRWRNVVGRQPTSWVSLLLSVLLGVGAFVVLVANGYATAGLVVAVLTVAVLPVLLVVSKMYRGVGMLLEQQRELTRVVAAQHAVIRPRLVKIDNIAGSTGRLAPLVRDLQSGQHELRTVLDEAVAERACSAPAAVALKEAPRPVMVAAGGVTSPPAPSPKAADEGPSTAHIPTVPFKEPAPTFAEVTVLMVADEFTLSAFSHEWTVLRPSPTDWESVLDREPIDLLFVESAWAANDGSWLYHLVGASAPRQPIVDLVAACRARGIPTLFWNKEDPAHYSDFLPTARLFDWVATTDADLIDTYIGALGHPNVFFLPFAAQHVIHNPARAYPGIKRDRGAVFGGMYFRDKYPERRAQMDELLGAADRLDLDIYARHEAGPQYAFPDSLRKNIRGSLTYAQMVMAYRLYKVVINVNSVVSSSTMCARRIYEAAACGAVVVTKPTLAIGKAFEDDEIVSVHDSDEAFQAMRLLLSSADERDAIAHRAQRRVWRDHTYTSRAVTVMRTVLPGNDGRSYDTSVTTAVLVATNRPDQFTTIVDNIARQQVILDEVLILLDGFSVSEDEVDLLRALPNVRSFRLLAGDPEQALGVKLQELVTASTSGFLLRMDDDDYYGPNYVEDLRNAWRFSGADLVGKEASYLFFEARGATYLTIPHREHIYTDFVRGATFAGPRETFERVGYAARTQGEDSDFLRRVKEHGGTVYAADRFNFVANRAADKSRHTWGASDLHLASTGVMKFYGDGRDQVGV